MSEWHKTMLSSLSAEASSEGPPERLDSVSEEAQNSLGTSRVCMITDYFGEVTQYACFTDLHISTVIHAAAQLTFPSVIIIVQEELHALSFPDCIPF